MRRPAHGPLGERLQGGGERRGVRVVGVVDGDAAAGQLQDVAAPGLQADRRGAAEGDVQRHAELDGDGQRREHVERLVAALQRELEVGLVAADAQPQPLAAGHAACGRAARRRPTASSPNVRTRRPGRSDDASSGSPAGTTASPSSGSAASSSPLAARDRLRGCRAGRGARCRRSSRRRLAAAPGRRARRSAPARAWPSRRPRPRCPRRCAHSVSGSPISLLWPAAAAMMRRAGAEHGAPARPSSTSCPTSR